jgi:hypothetical protein
VPGARGKQLTHDRWANVGSVSIVVNVNINLFILAVRGKAVAKDASGTLNGPQGGMFA